MLSGICQVQLTSGSAPTKESSALALSGLRCILRSDPPAAAVALRGRAASGGYRLHYRQRVVPRHRYALRWSFIAGGICFNVAVRKQIDADHGPDGVGPISYFGMRYKVGWGYFFGDLSPEARVWMRRWLLFQGVVFISVFIFVFFASC